MTKAEFLRRRAVKLHRRKIQEQTEREKEQEVKKSKSFMSVWSMFKRTK